MQRQPHKPLSLPRGTERCLSCAYFRSTVAKSRTEKQQRGYCSLFRSAVSIWGVCDQWSERESPTVIKQFESAHGRHKDAAPTVAEGCDTCGGAGRVRGAVRGHWVTCPACRAARESGQLALFQLKRYNKPKPRETD